MSIEFDIAQRFREEHGFVGRGGVVIIYFDTPTAWEARLSPASHYAPGCVAVFEDGRTYWSTGGNENDGSNRWEAFGTSNLMSRR